MLNKVAGILKQDTGVGYYRIGQPIKYLKTKKKSRITPFSGDNISIMIGDNDSGQDSWSDKLLMEIAKDADVIFSTIIINPDELVKILNLRKWSGAKWIVDIDDDLYSVSSDNPGKKTVEKYKDLIELCLKLADGVTVSVPRLKEIYGHLNPNIFINPNGIDFSWYKPNKREHDSIRIGWRGAYGHSGDLSLIEPAIEALRKDYDVTFVSLGVQPPFKSEHHPWVRFLEFPEYLAALDLDIAVVPLVDKPYNWGKSNLAVLEYSALKIPVVASPVENQKDMPISYAKNNFEWYQELEKLVKDADLRKKQAHEQYAFVKSNYDIEKLSPKLAEWMEKLPRKDI